MKKLLISLCILILSSILISSVAAETVLVTGLNNCEKEPYEDIGGSTPRSGYTFLVMGLKIDYNGGDKLSVDPNYFSLNIDNVDYPSSGATYYLDRIGLTALPTVTLSRGGSIEGYIAYEIPKDKMDSESAIVYSGWQDVRADYRC